jgi:hypothetical protein
MGGGSDWSDCALLPSANPAKGLALSPPATVGFPGVSGCPLTSPARQFLKTHCNGLLVDVSLSPQERFLAATVHVNQDLLVQSLTPQTTNPNPQTRAKGVILACKHVA